ncbi:hypothetical protein [Amycolatopsis pigmentata]|uniref:Uncharacterized protein n=1 Tax=Amycolatopsis pigmentata TaxID=450801 RepID=A0ABW5FWE6_9PSEU
MTEVAATDRVRGLVTELDSAGTWPAEFHPAFLAVAREWFVPARFWYQPGEGRPGRGGGPGR